MSERQHYSDPSEMPFSPYIDDVARLQTQMEFDLKGPDGDPYDYGTGVHNVGDSAAHDPKYHEQLKANIEVGVPDPKQHEQLKLGLDGKIPTQRKPYTSPAEGRPTHNQAFIDLVSTATDMAARPTIRGKDRWESKADVVDPATGVVTEKGYTGTKDRLAAQIQEFLDKDPSQIRVLLDHAEKLKQHTIEANEAVLGKQAKVSALDRPIAHARRQEFEQDPTVGDPAIDNVLQPPTGIKPINKMPDRYVGSDPKKSPLANWLEEERTRLHKDFRGLGRLKPGAADMRDKIDRYVGEYENRVRSAGQAVSNSRLEQGALESADVGGIPGLNALDKGTKALGLDALKTLKGAEARKYNRFMEIVGSIEEMNPDHDPDVIVAKYTDLETTNPRTYEKDIDPTKVDAYRAVTASRMAEWRRTGSEADDHAAFSQLHEVQNYLEEVSNALDVMSEYNPRYPRLYNLHDELAPIYNVAVYQEMRQRHENAARNGSKGRIEVEFLPDMGLWQEDGNDDVHYPDGSTAERRGPTALGPRLNPDGTPWIRPAAVSASETARIRNLIRSGNTSPSDLHSGMMSAVDQNFDRHTPVSRITAREYSQAAVDAAEAQIAEERAAATEAGVAYIDNPNARQIANTARYQALYHDIEPGVILIANMPHIQPDGSIMVNNTEMYGTTGNWVLHSDGTAERIELGAITERYNPYGTKTL